MSTYDDDQWEALRRRHREATEQRRLAERTARIEEIERAAQARPAPNDQRRLLPPLAPPPSLPTPPAPALPEPPAEPEDWAPGARPGRAWLGHYADVHGRQGAPEEALLPRAVPGHALVVGATRMGKTRLLLLLAGEALADGASVVALDLKDAHFTLGRLCAVADAAGLGPDERALFLPSVSPGPGWNPLLEGREAVGEVLGVFRALAAGSWGPKMDTLFRAALALLQQRRLSLFELPALIGDPAYLRALAGGAEASHLGEYLRERVTGKDADTDPVLNKLLPILDVPYFERCLCAERNTFSMGSLWRRRQLACFHLDRRRLSEEGAGALGSLAARRLFAAGIEPSGSGRVLLLADEAGEVDRLSGGRMERTLSEGGESRLSLLLACQYLSQLPKGLQESALTNANLKCFFRLGPEDVRLVDRALGDGWGARAAQLGPQHCLVQVGKGTPRVVRVADLDPRPVPGWERQGAPLTADEWEDLPERRRAGVREVIGGSLPRLDTPDGGWGRTERTPARRSAQNRDAGHVEHSDGGRSEGGHPEIHPAPAGDKDWGSDGLS